MKVFSVIEVLAYQHLSAFGINLSANDPTFATTGPSIRVTNTNTSVSGSNYCFAGLSLTSNANSVAGGVWSDGRGYYGGVRGLVVGTTSGHSLIFRTNDTYRGEIDPSGWLRVTPLAGSGNRAVYSDPNGWLVNTASDARLKTHIIDLSYGLKEVLQLRPVKYNWLDTKKRGAQDEIGLIAQEVRQVIPEVVGVNSDDTLSLDDPKLIPVLINAIKELKDELDQLKKVLHHV